MSKAERVKAKIRGLIDAANMMTGDTDSTLSDAVGKLLTGYGGGGTGVNAGIMTYKAPEGTTVNAGDFVELVREWGSGGLYTDAATAVAVAAMGDDRVMVVYTPKNNDQNGYAVLLSVDGPTTTASLPYVFTQAITHGSIAAVALSDSKVLVTYLNVSVQAGTAVVLTVDADGVISKGAAFTFTNTSVANLTLTALSDSKAVVIYRDADNTGKALVLSVDGTTVTAGTALHFDSNVRNPKLTTLSAGKVLVAYETYDWGVGAPLYGQTMALTVDGLTLTRGAGFTFRTSPVYYIDVAALSDDRALLVYSDSGDSDKPTARLLDISGRTVSSLHTLALNSGSGTYLAVTALSHNKALVISNVYTSRFEARAFVVTVNGAMLERTNGATFLTNTGAAAVTGSTLVAFSEASALLVTVAGVNAGLDSRTHYRGFTIDGTTATAAALDATGGTSVVPITSEARHAVGVAKTGGTDGVSVYVHRAGKSAEGGVHTTFTLYDGAATVIDGVVVYFTLAGETYLALEGMTWADWVASEYNTAGCYISEGVYVRKDGRDVLEGTGSATKKTTDPITAGGAYQLR